jgi:excisionase family DNA binding protein
MEGTTRAGERLLLDVASAAGVLGLGRTKLHELIAAGEVRSVKIGRRRLIPMAALDEYVDRLQRAAS